MHRLLFIAALIITINTSVFNQHSRTDANVVGHVLSNGQHISFATISIRGTAIGTATDETGHYKMVNLPAGQHTLVTSVIGFKPREVTIIAEAGKTIEVNFELEEDILRMDEIIVSADRSRQKRTEAPIIVNTIPPAVFNSTRSVTFGEGLNFSPGLRTETNCQNCGFTQVRMNGMEGPYSQILINSRPVFSGLAGVYGLELIPANMIERVEVVRGGGSALFGSNAIAGTINIILRDPVTNTYEIGSFYSSVGTGMSGSGGAAPDHNINFNTSIVSPDLKSGITLFGFTRDRKLFDADNDSFSEIAPMNNITAGTRFYHRFGYRGKLAFDFFAVNEERDGGNRQDFPHHERDIAESVKHNLKLGAVTFEQFLREHDLLSVYASGQFLKRDSYYGANRSLSDYGDTRDNTWNVGAHYKLYFNNSSLVTGLENTGGYLVDKKLGYPDYENAVIVDGSIIEVPHTDNILVADQSLVTSGLFAQYETTLNRTKIAFGTRFDNYRVTDFAKESEIKSGNVISPRLSLMYGITPGLQSRISYSKGYRAPQIFDEDLHIETSGSRQVINVNDPDLRQETSHSILASLDFNGSVGNMAAGFLMEGFYTRLLDPFVNEISEPDENGTVLYTRVNAEGGAIVKGINMELKLIPGRTFSLTSGFTLQSSRYDEEQEFDEKRFFRTPGNYGYYLINWDITGNFRLSSTGNYTGKMLVPYFGQETDPDEGELRRSETFFELGLKADYTFRLNGASLQISGGVRNIFNSYQSDFDSGIDRDPAYMYGPSAPRTIYLGFRFGNLLK